VCRALLYIDYIVLFDAIKQKRKKKIQYRKPDPYHIDYTLQSLAMFHNVHSRGKPAGIPRNEATRKGFFIRIS